MCCGLRGSKNFVPPPRLRYPLLLAFGNTYTFSGRFTTAPNRHVKLPYKIFRVTSPPNQNVAPPYEQEPVSKPLKKPITAAISYSIHGRKILKSSANGMLYLMQNSKKYQWMRI